jgi:hypothetical protein
LDALRELSAVLQESGGLAGLIGIPMDMLNEDEQIALLLADPGVILGSLNVSVAGLTGLSLESDILPVLDGDVITFLRLQANDGGFPPILPDLGLAIQTSDSAGAARLIEAFITASQAYDTGYGLETFGSGQALAMPLVSAFTRLDLPGLDLLFGSSEDLFVVGTRGASLALVSTAASDSLGQTRAFQRATAHLLPGANSVAYIGGPQLLGFMDQIVASGLLPLRPSDLNDLGILRTLLASIDSAAISSITTSAQTVTARAAISIAAEPPSLPDLYSGR